MGRDLLEACEAVRKVRLAVLQYVSTEATTAPRARLNHHNKWSAATKRTTMRRCRSKLYHNATTSQQTAPPCDNVVTLTCTAMRQRGTVATNCTTMRQRGKVATNCNTMRQRRTCWILGDRQGYRLKTLRTHQRSFLPIRSLPMVPQTHRRTSLPTRPLPMIPQTPRITSRPTRPLSMISQTPRIPSHATRHQPMIPHTPSGPCRPDNWTMHRNYHRGDCCL